MQQSDKKGVAVSLKPKTDSTLDAFGGIANDLREKGKALIAAGDRIEELALAAEDRVTKAGEGDQKLRRLHELLKDIAQ